jgi:protein-S-isoprenylcysteine O-methyltransferase Ste14
MSIGKISRAGCRKKGACLESAASIVVQTLCLQNELSGLEIGSSGGGYLPLLMVGIFIFALSDFEYIGHSEKWDKLWEIVCLLVSFLGLGIRGFTIGFTPKGTSGRNTKRQKAAILNTTGMYAVVRNPLYLGNFFMWLGIAMFAGLWWLILIYGMTFSLYYERIIFAEEAFLKEKFGDRFLDWARRTPAFIPKFNKWEQPSLPFSFRNVLRREYNGFFAVVITMFGLEVVSEHVKKTRKIDVHFNCD